MLLPLNNATLSAAQLANMMISVVVTGFWTVEDSGRGISVQTTLTAQAIFRQTGLHPGQVSRGHYASGSVIRPELAAVSGIDPRLVVSQRGLGVWTYFSLLSKVKQRSIVSPQTHGGMAIFSFASAVHGTNKRVSTFPRVATKR